jgi:hypothetical protein
MVHHVVQSSDISAGFSVALQKGVEVLFEDHAAGSDHNVILRLSLDILKVLIQRLDVGVVNAVHFLLSGHKELHSAALGVDVILTASSDVRNKGTGLGGNINLQVVNAAVAEVRKREVNYTISSQEGEAADRTIILKAVDLVLHG